MQMPIAMGLAVRENDEDLIKNAMNVFLRERRMVEGTPDVYYGMLGFQKKDAVNQYYEIDIYANVGLMRYYAVVILSGESETMSFVRNVHGGRTTFNSLKEAVGAIQRCAGCGSMVYTHTGLRPHGFTTSDNRFLCAHCARNQNYEPCRHCQVMTPLSELHTIFRNEIVCQRCLDSYCRPCADCGTMIRNMLYIQNEGCCWDCRPEVVEYEDEDEEDDCLIHEYGFKPIPIFKSDDGRGFVNSNLYLGVELEIDNGDDRYVCAEKILAASPMVYCKSDGSLVKGVEIVSHPATLGYHMNDLNWRGIMRACRSEHFVSHNTRTCGLHVHVGRRFFGESQAEQDLHIAKVVMLVNRFYDSHVVPFSRRKTFSYCAKGTALGVTKDDSSEVISYKLRRKREGEGRMVAVNLQNTSTIEFRIFRGTLKLETFFAALQFVDAICRFAKRISIEDVDTCTWTDICAGEGYDLLHAYNQAKELA